MDLEKIYTDSTEGVRTRGLAWTGRFRAEAATVGERMLCYRVNGWRWTRRWERYVVYDKNPEKERTGLSSSSNPNQSMM
jgi:hypothetical protein